MFVHNSVMSRVPEKNPAVCFVGCPCHKVNNAAKKGGEEFSFYLLLTLMTFGLTCIFGLSIVPPEKTSLKNFVFLLILNTGKYSTCNH